MIGWFVAGLLIGDAKNRQKRKREARKQRIAEQRETNRRRRPHPVAAWVVFALFAVSISAVTYGIAVPFMVILGVFVWAYERSRKQEHDKWLAEQAAEQVKHAENIVRDWTPPVSN